MHQHSIINPKYSINFSIPDHKSLNSRPMNAQSTSGWFEIRLFYVRITPCIINTVPEHLTLRNLRRKIGVSLEINGIRVPSGNTAFITLRRDRVDKSSSEVTYVSTDNVRVSGAVEFEVIDNELGDREMVLCGSLERIEPIWNNGSCNQNAGGLKSGWSMDFYAGNLMKFGNSSAVEVYIAGCCSSVPVILTKTIRVGSRRRQGVLDAIPEDEEVGKEPVRENVVVRHRKSAHTTGEEGYKYEPEVKPRPNYYSEEMYYDEDGQLTWFNAGVRVGVGIGLGMCLGIGIGVGLLMRSYQATTRNFRRRFF